MSYYEVGSTSQRIQNVKSGVKPIGQRMKFMVTIKNMTLYIQP